MENGFVGGVYAMGPRVPLLKPRGSMGTMTMTSTLGFKVPSPVLAAREATTTACTDSRLCEKPVGGSSMTLPIVLGVW